MSTRPDGSRPLGSSAAWSRGAIDGGDAPDPERYAPGGELGRGGMGVVEAAVDRWLDRDVAVKRPRAGRAEDHLARLTREARITARLVHPAIPPVYDVGEDERGPFYTMPVLVGATLQDRLASGESTRALVAAVATACRAAGYAHARGVVHRDLKPANVLLGAHGEVWVLDWGLALDPAQPDASSVGTPGFLAPEATEGRVVTPAADVYGLGETLRAVLDARPEPLPELRAVVARATRADPDERYPHGAAMAEDLERWLDGRLVRAHAYPAREILWHLAVRWRAPLAVAAVAVGIGAVLGVGALRAQHAERARADRSLSVSLAQQAAALRDARPEAEVLAAHSLALAENPLARGVLMAWAAAPPLALEAISPSPCEGPFVEPDGHVICVGDPLRVLDPQGRERWSASFPPVPAAGGSWVGEVVQARRYDDDAVVIRRSSNRVEVWRDGARAHVLEGHQGYLRLAEGPVPALVDQRRVGRLDRGTGAVVWGPETCGQIETAVVRDDVVVVACRDAVVFVGPFEAPGPPIALPGHPSALAWQSGPVIGTFDGLLIALDPGEPSGFSAVDTGAGVRQVLPLGAGRVAVVGERGEIGVWSARDGVALGALPRGGSSVASEDGDLLVFGAAVRRYAVPGALGPVRFDRAAEGGIAAFDVSPSGARIVAGSASGEVASWVVATGAGRREVPPGDATAKAVRFVGEDAFVHARRDEGLLRREIGSASVTRVSRVFAREVSPHVGGLALLPWSAGVVLLGDGERVAPLPARPLAATAAGALWVADERGGVHVLDGSAFAHRFDLPRPTPALAASGDRLLVADGSAVEARGPDGALVWRFDGTAPVTAIEATRDWVAVGDLAGGVRVLRPDGALVAGLTGHTRRVSGLVLRGDVLYSAGWDGVVRAWGLAGLDAEPPDLLARVTARWGLTLDEALAGAEPLGPAR